MGPDIGSYAKSSLTFGLADKAQAAQVTVYWPSGLKSVLENVGANQTIQIHEADELPLERPTEEGDVIAWGAGPNGETTIPGLLGRAVQIAAGDSHSAALSADGTVAVWGMNHVGQANVPAGLKDIVQLAAGSHHYLALDSKGKVYAWGWNSANQTSIPASLRRAKSIAAGYNTSYALTGDGRILAWGANESGQATIPTGLTKVTALAAGRGHALALKADGTVVAWGRNDYGQSTVPAGLAGVIQIAAGDFHSAALKTDGTVVAWGADWSKQATAPAGLANVVQISAEGDRALALKADNSIVNWGINPDNISPPPAPGSVLGIAAGAKHGLALVRKIEIAVDGDIPTGTEGSGLDFGFTATGGTGGNYTWSIPGTKPAWLEIDPATGQISGTPAAAGNYSFIVRASSGGRWGEIEVILEVVKPELAILWVATTGSDTAGDGSLAKPFATVQRAVNASRTGGTIMVQPGSYNGTVSIVGKSVKLISQSGEAQTTLRGVKGKAVIEIAGEGTLIDGFTITGGTGRPQPSSYGFDYYGGGIHCRTTATVKNCIIRGNGAGTPGRDSATFGGAIYSNGKPTDILTVENCVLAENYAWASGGATLTEISKILIDRCTVYKNDSRNFFGYQGGISLANGGKMDLLNSILWANGGDQIGAFAYPYNRGTVATVTYTLSQGGVKSGGIETLWPATGNGTGNISADPKLNNPDAGDYSLQTGSPAINAANPVLKDPDNTRADMGYQAGRRSGLFDSDNDGVNDYREMYDGTNPFDKNSFEPLSVGLVAHYPFDGNAKDESGYWKNGAVQSPQLTQSRTFNPNSAYAFDGVDDVINTGLTLPRYDILTFSTWFKTSTSNSKPETLISLRRSEIGNGASLGILDGEIYAGINTGFDQWAVKGPNVADGRWHHAIIVLTGSQIKAYLDGVEFNGAVNDGGHLPGSSYPPNRVQSDQQIWIGRGFLTDPDGGGTRSYNGDMEEVRIYDRALSAAEVSQLYSEESGEGANMVLVQGGTLPAGSALANQTVSAFHIARFETTWAEWKQVRAWAAANGYDIGTAGRGTTDNHPVRNVSWYDAAKWCNAKSQMEGLMPVYSVNGTTYKTGVSTPVPLATANGYRLPAEAEWEWAARGGASGQGYTYSGSNNADQVAWHKDNINGKFGSKPVGTKSPNELGIHDMSGNVWEFVWNPASPTDSYRIPRGGMWNTGLENLALNTRKVNNPDYNEIVNWGFRYARNAIGDMVTVQGGTLPESSELAGQTVQAFQIGRTEVTWDEWQTVRTWAAANGYTDLAGVGIGTEINHPVQQVNWYDVIKWSNALSEREGLIPVYSVNGTIFKTGEFIPSTNPVANGYRLPAEAEWEWAARGGLSSQGYIYSGSNDVNAVAWYLGNSGDGARSVSTRAANELGIYDMSGNVYEWVWDEYSSPDGYSRRLRGGAWSYEESSAKTLERYYGLPWSRTVWNGTAAHGFRLARNIGPKISITGELPEAVLNQPYAGFTFGVSGTNAPVAWSISEGTLPPGMSFSTTGTLTGTPTTAGTYTFVIRLESGGYSDEVEVELEVIANGFQLSSPWTLRWSGNNTKGGNFVKAWLSDGSVWLPYYALKYRSGKFLAGAFYSEDGLDWKTFTLPTNVNFWLNESGVAGNTFIINGAGNDLWNSTNGTSWTKHSNPGGYDDLCGIEFGNGTVVMNRYWSPGSLLVSKDLGNTWSFVDTGSFTFAPGTDGRHYERTIFGNNRFLFPLFDSVRTSADGMSWQTTAVTNRPAAFRMNSISNFDTRTQKFIGVQQTGSNATSKTITTAVSSNGTAWTFRDAVIPTTNAATFSGAGIGEGFLVVGGGTPAEIWVSIDEGQTWSLASGPWQQAGVEGVAFAASPSRLVAATPNKIYSAEYSPVWSTASSLPAGKVLSPYSANLTVAGGKPPYAFATKNGSALPAGITLNATTGRLAGAPTAAGNYMFTLVARDSSSPARTVERAFTLAVEPYGMLVSAPSTLSVRQYQTITPFQFTPAGGRPPYSWSTTPALPASLSINATTGILSGIANAAPGNYTVAVTVRDGVNQTASQNVMKKKGVSPAFHRFLRKKSR